MGALIAGIAAKIGSAFSGPLKWLIGIILDRLAVWAERKIRDLISDLRESARRKNQEKVDEKNEQEYQETISEESSPTQGQIDDATSDLLNGRRR